MFRHERPQSGRYREFYQYGIENIAGHLSGIADAEVISLAAGILHELKADAVLNINTLGDDDSKKTYSNELIKYFSQKKLSPISQKRLESGNLLRILDSKEKEDQEIIQYAPAINKYLSENALKYYNEVKDTLKELNVVYKENSKLVRGLDYYSNICFEFINNQNKAIIGGGRYDNLGNILNSNKNIGGIGWGAGIDRICEVVNLNLKENIIALIPISSENTVECLKIAKDLRKHENIIVHLKADATSFKQHMSNLKKISPNYIIFIGEDELSKNSVSIKNCKTGIKEIMSLSELIKNPLGLLKDLN